ncbi:hypothetical protein EST38_g3929 [Candolleomyces aberdarensis]|uniref:Asteroid domain-containing protein n=1 Tax=Candolleomyces aberdarensis TaxID=2316362 RepID=A0A4Q2DQW7_9AGAR|nr:hypothetical protein EST38_g3929 [Candolleomyces aberdarensis]
MVRLGRIFLPSSYSYRSKGAYPDLKFPTLVTRLSQSHVQPGLLFFRTSPTSRATPRSLNETRILPPLAYATCVHALKEIKIENDSLQVHFADEEGDPYAVELAGRLNGYVVGNDSDFVVLNTEGYRGYIPIDEMVWQASSLNDEPIPGGNDDFQVVLRPKANRKTNTDVKAGKGLIPPSDESLRLSVTVYTPIALADHFNLPVTLLPLLGAIVGNDFTTQMETNKRRTQSLLFERHLSVAQRIEHTAKVIRTVLTPNPNRRKGKHEVGSVMDLIERTVNVLVARFDSTLMGPGEIAQVVENIVEATLQYAIPKTGPEDSSLWPSQVCALHRPDACPFLPMLSRRLFHHLQDMSLEDEALLQVREKVIHAYRTGNFTPKNMDILSTSTCWPKIFLENPDVETVSRSISQPIRQWVYSILDDAVGLPDPPAAPEESDDGEESIQSQSQIEEEEEEEEDSDQDEIVDVVESDSEDESNVFAPLRGELNRLHTSEDEATEPPASLSSSRLERTLPSVVTEYLRRGTRIANEALTVRPLQDLLASIDLGHYNDEDAPSLLLRPKAERLEVMLRLLKSNTSSIRSLPPHKLASVLVVRWVAHILHARAQEHGGNKAREQEVWTVTEARCFLAAFTTDRDEEETTADLGLPELVDRNIQLMAQALAAFEAIEQLSQALLLEDRVPIPTHAISGKQFHKLLNDASGATITGVDDVWSAIEGESTALFRQELSKKTRKAKKASGPTSPQKVGNAAKRPTQGFYALLDSDMS